MATINLATKFETKLDQRFAVQSLTEVAVGNQYDWDGVNAIKVWTLDNPVLSDYNAAASANRFGEVSEVTDEVNTYQLLKMRSFAKTFDETNVQDQKFIKKATAYLKQVWDEVYTPEIDTYRLKVWAQGAGMGGYNSTALTKANIVERMLTAQAELDSAGVPHENRYIFARASVIIKYKLADEFKTADGIMTKYVIRGQKGEVDGSPLISVPDSRMPKGVDFIIKYKQATADPMKLKKLRSNDNVPGIAGTLMEGLVRFDAFVLANKANGVYISASDSTAVVQNVSVTYSENKVTLASATSGATVKYTVNGRNPKTDADASTYSAAFTVKSGDIVRAYASKAGLLNSAITEYKVE